MEQEPGNVKAQGEAPVFRRVRELADRYIGAMKEAPEFNRHAAGEVLELIRDLDVILEMIREQEAMFRAQLRASGGQLTSQTDRTVERVKLLTRAFYYFAGRIRTILRDADLPYLGTSRKRPAAWRVRDDMLEHYQSNPDAISSGGFSFGGPDGPSFSKSGAKGLLESGKLLENAKGFAAWLEGQFTAALSQATKATARNATPMRRLGEKTEGL